jgi:hypothetical protein
LRSPYARTGVLWEMHRRHYGAAGDPLILVAQGGSRDFNATLPQSVVDRALERDAAAASAEFLGQFRRDIEAFISRDTIDGATVPRRTELPRVDAMRYVAFVDPSGGGDDGYALALAHCEGRRIVLDLVRERRRCSPDAVTQEYAALIKAYGIAVARGDAYAGLWPRERFALYGIDYQRADKPKSDLYRDFLPLLNSNRCELLDDPRLAAQLCALERSTGRSGRDTISHPPNGHDDLANACAGALVLAARVPTQQVKFVEAFVAGRPRYIPGQHLCW